MKGIILAGGQGTRLYPATLTTSKQLLAVYDKPMIYHPLSVLMLTGVREILIISTPEGTPALRTLLRDGRHLGLDITYAVQDEPRGIAEAFVIGAAHIGDSPVALVLGDNVFHGAGFPKILQDARAELDGCTLFGYPVGDPERYGIAETDAGGKLISLEEKPTNPRSRTAVTGLYFYAPDVVDIARTLSPSERGELEITDVNQIYLKEGRARIVRLGRGYTWLDAGTHESLLEASQYVHVIEKRQGIRVACIEEVALRMGYIDADQCIEVGMTMRNSEYGQYLIEIAKTLA